MKLDAKDLRILSTLDTDCRLSARQVGKLVNASPETINYRIKNLEKRKVIEKYFAQINFFKLGYTLIRLYVKTQNASSKTLNAIISKVLKEKNLWAVYETTGTCDIAMGLLVKDLSEYTEFQNRFVKNFGKFIASKDAAIFTGIAYFPKKYLNKKDKDYTQYYFHETKEIEEIDETDHRILTLLTENAKTHILTISKKIGLTANAVKYRIKRLEEKKIIIGYRAQINSKATGYKYYKVDVFLNDTSIVPALREHIQQHPNIIFEDLCIGGTDFEFDAEFKNDEEMQAAIDELYELFPEKIRNHTYYKAKKVHVYNYYLND